MVSLSFKLNSKRVFKDKNIKPHFFKRVNTYTLDGCKMKNLFWFICALNVLIQIEKTTLEVLLSFH